MAKIDIKNIYRNSDEFIGHAVTIDGWVRTVRSSNKLGFMEVNDGSFFPESAGGFRGEHRKFQRARKNADRFGGPGGRQAG